MTDPRMQNAPQAEVRGVPRRSDERLTEAQSTASATDLLARASRHGHALRVVWQRADGRPMTTLYATLPAAERKVARVRERGLCAVLELVRLVPVSECADALAALNEEVAE